MYDLDVALDREELASTLAQQIDITCRDALKDKPRTHLGMSEVGEKCKRKVWGKWRWLGFEDFDGRMRRLFKRGHDEELKVIKILERLGVHIQRTTEDGQRFIVSGVGGHYGGENDGFAIFPPNMVKQRLLFECKTANDKNFKAIQRKGIIKHYPKHFAQMSSYGAKFETDYAIYIVVNKNDDDLFIQIVKLDHKYAAQLEKKAESIIRAVKVPTAISLNPSHQECKFCFLSDQCHGNELPIKNCRSCRMAEPVPGKQWFCHQWKAVIPTEEIPKGCDAWNPWRMRE